MSTELEDRLQDLARRLTIERDQALEEMANVTAERDAALASAALFKRSLHVLCHELDRLTASSPAAETPSPADH